MALLPPAAADVQTLVDFFSTHNTVAQLYHAIRYEEHRDHNFCFIERCDQWQLSEFPVQTLLDCIAHICELVLPKHARFSILDFSHRFSLRDTTKQSVFHQVAAKNSRIDMIHAEKAPRPSKSAPKLNIWFLSWLNEEQTKTLIKLVRVLKPALVFITGDARGSAWRSKNRDTFADNMIVQNYNMKVLTPGQVCAMDYFRKDVMRDESNPDTICVRSCLTVFYRASIHKQLAAMESKEPSMYSTNWYFAATPTMKFWKYQQRASLQKQEEHVLEIGTRLCLETQDLFAFVPTKTHEIINKLLPKTHAFTSRALYSNDVVLDLDALRILHACIADALNKRENPNMSTFTVTSTMIEMVLNSIRNSKKTKDMCADCKIEKRLGRYILFCTGACKKRFCSDFCHQRTSASCSGTLAADAVESAAAGASSATPTSQTSSFSNSDLRTESKI